MNRALLILLALGVPVFAAPVEKLGDFELADQDETRRSYRFPKARVSVMAIADHKGSDQLAPWIERLYQRYERRIDIDGVADVSMIPAPFHGMFRRAFKKQLAYPVMLDWQGAVVGQFGYEKAVANIYVIDHHGNIVARRSGTVSDAGVRDIARAIDRAIANPPKPAGRR